jgi:2,3-dihydroxy-p-cumate/2,3-dihydroxybenzoate 3,4-dioxygenase
VLAVIHLQDLCYVRLGTRDRATAVDFAREVLGLQLARDDGDASYLRSDTRDHTLAYVDGDPADPVVGFELRSAADLQRAAAALSDLGLPQHAGTAAECEQRRVADFVGFRDPSGNRIELAVRTEEERCAFAPMLDVGVTGFSHIGLCTTDARRDECFWTRVFDARVSDRIGDAPLLRIDTVHHKLALFPSPTRGVQHVNHQVATLDDVMRAWYRLRSLGVRIVFGPGRHPTSNAVFLYFEGPDGMIYEYSSGVRLIDADQEAAYRPRQFPLARQSFCEWGAVPDIPQFASG